eukprot:8994971-Karenia_brevis.AAC.1
MQAVSRLKSDKCQGGCGLIAEAFRALPLVWLVMWHCLFGMILRGESFPESWAFPRAYFIPKSSSPHDVFEFRQI